MTPFQKSVLNVVRRIPKGKILSYQQVAKKAGFPKASRAVGTLLSKNINPKIPCHRVIRSDGGMGGYNRGGIQRKREILIKEKALEK